MLRVIDDHDARLLLKRRKVAPIWCKKRIIALRQVSSIADSDLRPSPASVLERGNDTTTCSLRSVRWPSIFTTAMRPSVFQCKSWKLRLRSCRSRTPETLCGRTETASVIRAAVGGLESRRHAELLALRYQDDLTLREIGARWGVTESAGASDAHNRFGADPDLTRVDGRRE